MFYFFLKLQSNKLFFVIFLFLLNKFVLFYFIEIGNEKFVRVRFIYFSIIFLEDMIIFDKWMVDEEILIKLVQMYLEQLQVLSDFIGYVFGYLRMVQFVV